MNDTMVYLNSLLYTSGYQISSTFSGNIPEGLYY